MSARSAAPVSSEPLTRVQWLICVIAAIGFAFDTYELLMLPLIVRPAVLDLTGAAPGTPEFTRWTGLLFYAPAVFGGVFGLLGGYLTDLLGRRRVLTWSILLYAFSAFAAGFATSIEWLLFFRVTTFIGVCVEFVAAVAWLAELFPNAKRREAVLGYTQAFGSVGGLLVTAAYAAAATYADSLPAVRGVHEAWRYTMMSGIIPAIPLIIIRPFLPESPKWLAARHAGTLKRPSVREIWTGNLRRTTIVTTLMVACSYAAAFGAIQHVPRMVPSLPEVQGLERPAVERAVAGVQTFQEMGGLTGRWLLAILAVRIVNRRLLLRLFQIPGLILLPIVFLGPATNNLDLLRWGIFLVGLCTVGQFSFWGNYLPRVYPTHLRGTGESFAANVGGRMLGTGAALITTELSLRTPGDNPGMKLAVAAAAVGTAVYAINLIASFWLPEPKEGALPE
jgi:nitrate/nitrite transporter NarK